MQKIDFVKEQRLMFCVSSCTGLRLIDESGSGVDSEEDEKQFKRISPVIPLVVPLALKPRGHYQTEIVSENLNFVRIFLHLTAEV